MADDLKIVIEKDGLIKPLNTRLSRWLSKRAGLWQLVPTAENLLVFSRLGSEKGPSGSRTGELEFTGSAAAMGGLMDMIMFLSNTKRSGAFVVLADDIKKTLFLTDGDVRMATSNVPEDRLGALMYRLGLVTKNQLREALKQQTGERRLGRVLIDMGVITAHDLYTIIRKQVEEIFYSVLMIRTGVFYFYKVDQTDGLPAQINLTTQNLLLEGVRRIDEMSYFREKIPSQHSILEIRPDIAPQGLNDLDDQIYQLVDGQSSVLEIAREMHLGEFEATKIIFNLMQLGYVQRRRDTNITRLPIAEKAQVEPDAYRAVVDTFNAVLKKIFTEVQSKGKEPVLREAMVSFFQGDTAYSELYQGVELGEDGTIPAQLVLDNLSTVEVANRMEYLYSGLNELLFFKMFSAGESLPRQEEEELQAKLNAIISDFS
jgi:predicted transcriptional regulator